MTDEMDEAGPAPVRPGDELFAVGPRCAPQEDPGDLLVYRATVVRVDEKGIALQDSRSLLGFPQWIYQIHDVGSKVHRTATDAVAAFLRTTEAKQDAARRDLSRLQGTINWARRQVTAKIHLAWEARGDSSTSVPRLDGKQRDRLFALSGRFWCRGDSSPWSAAPTGHVLAKAVIDALYADARCLESVGGVIREYSPATREALVSCADEASTLTSDERSLVRALIASADAAGSDPALARSLLGSIVVAQTENEQLRRGRASLISLAAACDLARELARWAKAHRFDDDQDPGLDTPDQRLVRAHDRLVALVGDDVADLIAELVRRQAT